jgi:hypothetical protein
MFLKNVLCAIRKPAPFLLKASHKEFYLNEWLRDERRRRNGF